MSYPASSVSRILIYRLGSIGDTVVALPALHLINRVFPEAEKRILTNMPNGPKEVSIQTVLGPNSQIKGYIQYPLKTRNPRILYKLACDLRQWNPQLLIYLAQFRGSLKTYRDALFFKLCGIQRSIGIPWTKDLQRCRRCQQGLWEHESERLVRCIKNLGEGRSLSDGLDFGLYLTDAEREKARRVLEKWTGRNNFICFGAGTKSQLNDWGNDNWTALSMSWSARHPGVGLVMVGSSDEYGYSQKAADAWKGPILNLCGSLNPRESAAVIEQSVMFVGHDSGMMHVAASVEKPCVAIFSAKNLPGEWYPKGNQHKVIYHRITCYGCRLTHKCPNDKECIRSISVDEVKAAMNEIWSKQSAAA